MPSVPEMMQDLQTADAHGDTALATHIAAQIKAAQAPAQPQTGGAVAGEQDLGGVGNAALAAGIGFVHNLPLVGDAGLTAGRWAKAALEGNPVSWQQANADTNTVINSAQQQHPVASTVGGVGGGVASALVGGAALRGAGIGGSLALRAGQPIANAARLVGAGAIAGGVQGAAQAGGSQLAGGHVAAAVPAAVQGGAVGALTGAAVGGATAGVAGAGNALRALAPLPGKTALALSKVFGESASDLQAAWDQFSSATGRAPSMAELANLKQTGAIRSAAKGSSAITDALSARAAQAPLDRSAAMQAQIAPPDNVPASSGELANARTAQGDIDYPASRAAPDFQIPTAESADLGGVSPADHLAGEVVPSAGLGKADRVRIVGGLQNGTLSSQDAQILHSGLSTTLNRSYSPAVAGHLADLQSILAAPGNEASNAALNTARANMAAAFQREAGAAHGESVLGTQTAPNFNAEVAAKPNDNPEFQAGLPLGARSKMADTAATPQGSLSLARQLATDDSLHAKLSTALGPGVASDLRTMGQQEVQSDTALAPFRGKTADDETAGATKRVLQGVMAGVSHGAFAIYHAAKAMSGWNALPPGVGEKVAQYLADPKMAQQGINLLRKAGANNAQLRQIAIGAASNAAAGAAALTTSSVPEQSQ